MRKEDKYNPIYMFNKYKELIYEVDELWDEFQRYLRDIAPDRRDEKFFEHHREPQSMDIWDQILCSRYHPRFRMSYPVPVYKHAVK